MTITEMITQLSQIKDSELSFIFMFNEWYVSFQLKSDLLVIRLSNRSKDYETAIIGLYDTVCNSANNGIKELQPLMIKGNKI